jgi:hypothetical protein
VKEDKELALIESHTFALTAGNEHDALSRHHL